MSWLREKKNRNGPFIRMSSPRKRGSKIPACAGMTGSVGMLKLAAIAALAIVFLCLGLRAGFKPGKGAIKEAQASPSGGWLAGYGYQKAIVIDNTSC